MKALRILSASFRSPGRMITTKSRRRPRKRWAALVCCLLLVVPAVSYVRALLYPGSASFAVRSVE
jgi:hypothetical protein